MSNYYFILQDRIVPKARPRFNGNFAYTASPYRNWKEQAISTLLSQKIILNLTEPIEHFTIYTNYYGSAIGDRDNIEGSILDALTQAEIIKGDNLKRNPQGSFNFSPSKLKYAEIEIVSCPIIPLWFKLLKYKSTKRRQTTWQQLLDTCQYTKAGTGFSKQTKEQDLIKNLRNGFVYNSSQKIINDLNLDFETGTYQFSLQQNYFLNQKLQYSSFCNSDLTSLIYELN